MLPKKTRIFIATRPVDLRGAFDKLGGIVREFMSEDPRSGAMFVFINRRANRIKILFFDATGDCLLYKRLDRRTFRGVIDLDPEVGHVEIAADELRRLLVGAKKPPRRRTIH